MRALTVTIDWICFIVLAACIIWLIVALAKKNRKMTKYAAIASVVVLIITIICCRIALNY